MRASEIRELIRVKPVELDATRRRLSACHDIADLRAVGRRLIPRPVFDYVDGGADEELSLRANTRAFRQFRFQPRTLVDVSEPDTSAAFLGSVVPLPLALAPTGYTRMMHPGGEIAAARAAQRHGLPYTLSTMATTTIEAVAEAAQPDLWFQLYILRDSGLNKELVDRAAAAKYRVLVVTVDCFVTGHRTRDRRNGLVIPPELTVQTLASIAGKPGYWIRMLRNPAIDFANFAGHDAVTIEDTGQLFNPAITWDDIADLRARWPGRLIVKGPLGPADAARAVSVGADGVQLSNHGGRQLDRAVPPVTHDRRRPRHGRAGRGRAGRLRDPARLGHRGGAGPRRGRLRHRARLPVRADGGRGGGGGQGAGHPGRAVQADHAAARRAFGGRAA